MKVLFAGPSLFGSLISTAGLTLRGPAAQGDVARAVLAGASMIGLVDGYFGFKGAVWHKEILFALSRGLRVLGAASMGALRAAECAPFGMESVGVIAERFLSGALDDDAAVALTHASAEDGYRPLSEPLVDVEHRVQKLIGDGALSLTEGRRIEEVARALFFQDRTVETLLGSSLGASRAREVEPLYRAAPSLKQQDAEALVKILQAAEPASLPRRDWKLETPTLWARALARLQPG